MNIGILGSGNIGHNAARLFARAGHLIAISNSRGPQSLVNFVHELGHNAQALSAEEVVQFGDVILLAIPWVKRDELPDAQLFTNKIVIDAMNPYSAIFQLIDLSPSTSSEEVARQLPQAHIVKAFNTMYFETLRTGGRTTPQNRLVIFLAGDNAQAKAIVSQLIEEIGFAPLDTGSLHEGGLLQQPGSPIYNIPLTVEEARKRLAQLP
ncbi:NADPH-dependent F420 reductase [Tengunoibacter tsumagoiensis]|uniref:NADP oxidoreductase n=1 Tax=Tengunoibacter tsumagoiensis TaxID=2014871 RepID=A0A402A184_9CHLR|nr:NADPH-dependent F420 reductase [Tengunoibacter tsumagoiensis]GCE12893.1 NADP oxidoreductase [Tengunoibacter tsumagoiensis]